MNKLQVGDTGTFNELSLKDNPDMLTISYNPPIEAILERARNLKGEKLSETEVGRIRANAPAIAIPQEVHEATFSDANK